MNGKGKRTHLETGGHLPLIHGRQATDYAVQRLHDQAPETVEPQRSARGGPVPSNSSDTKVSEQPDATYVLARLKSDDPDLARQVIDGSCDYCIGASVLRSRGGHDPACPAAVRLPITTPDPQRPMRLQFTPEVSDHV